MNVAEIVNTCRSRGVVLDHDGRGGLLVDGPEEELSDELLGLLAVWKRSLLAEISGSEKRSGYSENPTLGSALVPDTANSQNIQDVSCDVETETPPPVLTLPKPRRFVFTKEPTHWSDGGQRIELPAGTVGEIVDPLLALADDPHRRGLAVELLREHRRRYRPAVAVLLAGRVRVLTWSMLDRERCEPESRGTTSDAHPDVPGPS
jgi:hypothetical protein